MLGDLKIKCVGYETLTVMLDGTAFRRRLTITIALAYFGPPLIGLMFIVAIAKVLTTDQVVQLMQGSILPFYILATSLAAMLFFRWYLRPITVFADGNGDVESAVKRMRQFLPVYWGLFLLRHFLGALVVLTAADSALGMNPTNSDWARMFSLALMLSSVIGLPVFVYIVDFFAATFKDNTLREPVLRVRTRVFMIAVLLPILLNTAVLQYLVPRLGGLSAELISMWVVLLLIALAAAYNLMRSLDVSMTGLQRVSQRGGSPRDLRPQELRVRSMDEMGVLTCEYREILTNLQQQTAVLDVRNQILTASNNESDSDAVFAKLLEIAAGQLSSPAALLVAVSATASVEVLATTGDDTAATTFTASQGIADAIGTPNPTLVSMAEAPWSSISEGDFVVLPLRESGDTNETLAVFAKVDHLGQETDWAPIQLLVQLSPEIAAAARAARVAKEKSTLERMLLDAQRMEVIGRLAAGVAHDFNNILMVIVGAAGILKLDAKEAGAPMELINEHADLIMEASGRATDLTRQLLTFSKPNEGKTRVLNLNETLQSLDKFLRRLLSDDIRFEMSLDDVHNIKADNGHIEQVITNLVINARDAMEQGGPLLVETTQNGDWVELRVIDSGSGMSADVAAHVFEPFFTTKAKDKGTGLGLATVYGIVKNYGGTIEIDSAVGKGTVMLVRFPSTRQSKLSATGSQIAIQDDSSRTILLVEDDDQIRRIVGGLLVKQGHRVIEVANGEDAVEVINSDEDTIHLLLSDIIMPGIKGTEVATEMAKKRSKTKILLMTGYADSDVLTAASKAGRELINKPFTPEQLLSRVGELLR